MPRSRIYALTARYSIMAIVTLLIVEFLLGIWVNLYAVLPVGTNFSLAQQPDFYGKLGLGVHLILGVVLGILTIIPVIFTALLKKVLALILGVLGVLSVVIAGFSGLALANGGYANNGESFIMAVGFLIAILIYINLGRLVNISSKEQEKTSGLNMNVGSQRFSRISAK